MNKNKKQTIEVRKYDAATGMYEIDGKYEVIETIQRTLRAEAIGNFNPIFCKYKDNPRVLVHSDEGDISDPFRREESYLKTLFIKI